MCNKTSKKLDCLINNSPHSAVHAQKWFQEFCYVSSELSQHHAVLELEFHLNNNNKTAYKNLLNFENNCLKNALIAREYLIKIYLQSPWRLSMHDDDKGIIFKKLSQKQKVTNQTVSELQIKENLIISDYRRCISKIKSSNLNLFKYEDKIQKIFDELLTNRLEQGNAVSSKCYADVAFAEIGRVDYGSAECESLRSNILKFVVPALKNFLHCEPALYLNNPLYENQKFSWMFSKIESVLYSVQPSFCNFFKQMQIKKMMDVEPGSHKTSGAFTLVFPQKKQPFLIGNFSTNFKDIMTFFHEFGHSIHVDAFSKIDNVLLRQPGLDVCELSALGMEILVLPFLHMLWPSASQVSVDRVIAMYFLNMLRFFPMVAAMDEWQHTVYSADYFYNAQQRNELWASLCSKYGLCDGKVATAKSGKGWLQRSHLFTSPFYYIEYAIAQFGALQMWEKAQNNYPESVQNYTKMLGLGGSCTVSELFRAAGVELDFSENKWLQTVDRVKKFIANVL